LAQDKKKEKNGQYKVSTGCLLHSYSKVNNQQLQKILQQNHFYSFSIQNKITKKITANAMDIA